MRSVREYDEENMSLEVCAKTESEQKALLNPGWQPQLPPGVSSPPGGRCEFPCEEPPSSPQLAKNKGYPGLILCLALVL